MGPLYFDIHAPVFVMRTYIVHILNSSTLKEVRILNFEYVYRVMHSEKLVHELKVGTYMEKYVNQGLTVQQ
jgi:hypothetical protein